MSELVSELAPMTSTGYGRSRTNLSLHHLLAACRFAATVHEVEHANTSAPFGEFWEEILQNAIGVATLTVAALESFANELYFEGSAIAPVLNSAAAAECLEIVDRQPILRKYSLVLAFRSQRRLEFGIPQVQNIDALVRLRNAIVHFRREWFGAQEEHDKLSKRLQYRFSPSPFLPGEPLFPRAWASRSFVSWALQSTIGYIDYFYAEAKIHNPVDQFRERIVSLAGVNGRRDR